MDDFNELTAVVEALLFVSERPLPVKELTRFLGHTSETQVREALSALATRYATSPSGLQIEDVAGGFRLSTRPEFGEAVKEFFRIKNRQKLSRAGLETCAIIAYKQPVTHPEIQEIRGVSAEGVLRTLMERRLVRIVGRKDTVGKPLLYGTTKIFLEHFGLASLDDLPPVEELGEMLGEESTGHLAAALDALPGGEATAILPLDADEAEAAGETEPDGGEQSAQEQPLQAPPARAEPATAPQPASPSQGGEGSH